MSAPPIRVPRAAGERIVRPRMTARERLARIVERRELLVGMVRKELKIKYKNSILGFAWSLLNPLLYLVVFYVAFTIILKSGIPAFPIWLLSGLLVWNLFSTGLGAATGSVVGNAALVKKVSFPREILPLAAVGSMLVHFFLQSIVLFVVLAIVQWHVAWAYVPAHPARACRAPAGHECTRDPPVGGQRLPARHAALPRARAAGVVLALAGRVPVPAGRRAVRPRLGAAPFVREGVDGEPRHADHLGVPARDLRPARQQVRRHTQLLPHWPYWAFVAYLGMSVAFGVIVLMIAMRVFGRSEANFAEEL